MKAQIWLRLTRLAPRLEPLMHDAVTNDLRTERIKYVFCLRPPPPTPIFRAFWAPGPEMSKKSVWRVIPSISQFTVATDLRPGSS